MPKYKVKYAFEVEVEAPNEHIAKINADYHLTNYNNEYYLWDYETHNEVIELEVPEDLKEEIENGKQTALSFKFEPENNF